jgi:hypothetical protein
MMSGRDLERVGFSSACTAGYSFACTRPLAQAAVELLANDPVLFCTALLANDPVRLVFIVAAKGSRDNR